MTGMIATGAIPLSYAYLAQGGGGRMQMPVSPVNVIYSNFKHVRGFAAHSGDPVATVDRLKILDTLIERLEAMKSDPLAAVEKPADLSEERIDALIQQYSSELRTLAVAPVAPYSFQAPVESGMLFTLAA